MTDRRQFLGGLGALGALEALTALGGGAWLMASPQLAWAAAPDYRRLLVLVELKGGNDGMNTIIPIADQPTRYCVRGWRSSATRSCCSTKGQAPIRRWRRCRAWQARELAVVQSVGYPQANLSHFRSIEIWGYRLARRPVPRRCGWLGRVFAANPPPAGFAADGVAVGSADMGPQPAPAPARWPSPAANSSRRWRDWRSRRAEAGQRRAPPCSGLKTFRRRRAAFVGAMPSAAPSLPGLSAMRCVPPARSSPAAPALPRYG